MGVEARGISCLVEYRRSMSRGASCRGCSKRKRLGRATKDEVIPFFIFYHPARYRVGVMMVEDERTLPLGLGWLDTSTSMLIKALAALAVFLAGSSGLEDEQRRQASGSGGGAKPRGRLEDEGSVGKIYFRNTE